MMVGLGSMSRNDTVSEIYSPPRVSALARRMGLRKGFALDLTVVGPDDGRPWDFRNSREARQSASNGQRRETNAVDRIANVHSIFELTEV